MTDYQLATLIGQRFIARKDAFAWQETSGIYRPARRGTPPNQQLIPMSMDALIDHVQGKVVMGHYMLDDQSRCKYFAFDIDLITGDCKLRKPNFVPECCARGHGNWVQLPDLATLPEGLPRGEEDAWLAANSLVHGAHPRAEWRDRAHPGRSWWKTQMRRIGDMLASRIRRELGIPALTAYTGSKGIHVYGFTGLMPAADAREAALLVLQSFDRFQPTAGVNFWGDTETDWFYGFPNFSIEVFPKQDSVEPGHFGNLMRLPLGINYKGSNQPYGYDPTFFIDERAPEADLQPHDPIHVLTHLDPFLPLTRGITTQEIRALSG